MFNFLLVQFFYFNVLYTYSCDCIRNDTDLFNYIKNYYNNNKCNITGDFIEVTDQYCKPLVKVDNAYREVYKNLIERSTEEERIFDIFH